MKRFEIWTCAGGIYASKPRPAVIVQAAAFADFESVTVLPVTTAPHASPFRVKLMPDASNGLASVSFVMVEKITTVKKSGLAERIGILGQKDKTALLGKLAQFLGIG